MKFIIDLANGINNNPTSRALILLVMVIFGLALYGFSNGAGTTEIADMPHLSLATWLYYTASLFVLGGVDIGLPVRGGMMGSYELLWIAYFLAPIVTTTFVLDTIRVLLTRRQTGVLELNEHVILIGQGDLAMAYLNAIRTVDPHVQVLWVTHQADESSSAFTSDPHHTNVTRVTGNTLEQSFLRSLLPSKARRAIALHSDDIVNLELSWALLNLNESLVIACHVSDLALLRPANQLSRDNSGPQGRAPSTFSAHRIASLQVYDLMMEPYFLQTGGRDGILVAGFGRFAQTLLELVTARGADEVGRLTVLAKYAGANLRQLEVELDLSAFDLDLIEGDIQDPRSWETFKDRPTEGPPPLIVLALSDLAANFRAATLLRHHFPESKVLVRCFQKTAFTQTMAAQLNVELICLEDILDEALVDHYEALSAI